MMDIELLKGFIKQVESYLPTIRSGILVCAQKGNLYGELHTSLREVESIKTAASIVGFDDVVKVSIEFEKNLKKLLGKKEPLTDVESRKLLDKLTELEVLLTNIHFGMDDASEDVFDFIEESFDNLQINPPQKEINLPIEQPLMEFAETENIEEDRWDTEEFEIDDEMLEIFTIEAEDIVRNIHANLQILEKAHDNREALMEVRRNAHTLKGSAGIVGLKQLSDLAHRVEDLLDFLAENELAGDDKIFELLLTSTDCFEALGSGDKSEQLMKKIARTYQIFDKLMATLTGEAQVETALVENVPDLEEVQNTEKNLKHQSPKPVVRISLEKLDDLVNIVSGLIISRSVFEQRLADFERQIGELHHSTIRLQRSTNKLETDSSTGSLAIQPSNFGFQFAASTFGKSQPFSMDTQLSSLNSQLFDTLEFDRYTELHQTTRELIETTADTSAISTDLHNLKGNLELLFENQRRLIDEMQEKLLRLRMVSFGSLSVRLHRTVRVVCDEEEKSAELFIEGEGLEVDTQILDSLIEPLLHLLRNSVAHGIETSETRRMLGKPEHGKINLRLVSEGTHISLSVTDDGRGISVATLKDKAVQNGLISEEKAAVMTDAEAFELVFLPGLTTAEKLSQVSGRGVGLNIVKTNVLRQQGTILINSEPQKGTTFTIRLPMALAVTRAIMVKANQQIFAFPLKLVKHITDISSQQLETNKHSLQVGETNYKVLHLNELLNMPVGQISNNPNIPILLLETLEKPCALMVDEIIKTEEIVIKPLGSPLQNLPELLGATILGDGGIVPVLDVVYLLKQQISSAKFKDLSQEPKNQDTKPEVKKIIPLVLIVDDSPSVRHLTSNIIKNAGWTAIIAKDGLEALEILQDCDKLPDIILTDVEMPRMDGYELLASLKELENLKAIPVVMITSRTSPKHRQKAVDLGISEYLTKPFEDTKLIGIINNLTQSSNQQ